MTDVIGSRQADLEARIAKGDETIAPTDLAAAIAEDQAEARITKLNQDRQQRDDLNARREVLTKRHGELRSAVVELEEESATGGDLAKAQAAIADGISQYVGAVQKHNSTVQRLKTDVDAFLKERAAIVDAEAALNGDPTAPGTEALGVGQSPGAVQLDELSVFIYDGQIYSNLRSFLEDALRRAQA